MATPNQAELQHTRNMFANTNIAFLIMVISLSFFPISGILPSTALLFKYTLTFVVALLLAL